MILDESIDRLVAFSRRLDEIIEVTSNSKSLPSLMNTRAKVQAELTYSILVALNPKLKLAPDSLRSRDFARLIQTALLRHESPPKPPKDPEGSSSEQVGVIAEGKDTEVKAASSSSSD